MNKRSDKSPRRSQLSQRIAVRFLLSIMGYMLLLTGGYFAAYMLLSRVSWMGDDPLYIFFKTLQFMSPMLILVLSMVGLYFITRHFLSVPLRYLDSVTAAAAQLAAFGEETIALPPELADTQNELNLVRERAIRDARAAKEAEQRKNDLIVYLAHDLKTPLTSVIGYLSLLRDEPDIPPASRARYTGIALDKAERLEELINEFFDITRFNLSHLELNRQTVNLTRMLEQTVSEFEPVLVEKSLRFETELEPGMELMCDPDKLERVFDNLLRNAVSYSYPGTEISVTLHGSGDGAVVTVENHGRTIPPEKLARIFEQFFRADQSRSSATGGSGLGLAIAKEIAELHGGCISAESADERVRFTVTLPWAGRGSPN